MSETISTITPEERAELLSPLGRQHLRTLLEKYLQHPKLRLLKDGFQCYISALEATEAEVARLRLKCGEAAPEGTEIGDSVWSFLKKFPVGDLENASNEKLREVIALQMEYLEIFSGKNVQLTRKVDWLAEQCADGANECPYLSYYQDLVIPDRPEYCTCSDTEEGGFDCSENPKECWLKEVDHRVVGDAPIGA